MTRREPRANTRARILEAAASEFAKRGIDATPLSRVAEAAGLTKGAIYSNFASKDELVFALIETYGSRTDYSMFLDMSLSFEEQFRELGRATARTVKGVNRRLVQLDRTFGIYLQRNARARSRLRELNRTWAHQGGLWLDALAQARGSKLPMPGERLVRVLQALTRGLTEEALQDSKPADEEFFADAFGLIGALIEEPPVG